MTPVTFPGQLANRERLVAESAGLAAQLGIIVKCVCGRLLRERRQAVSGTGPVALVISRLQLAARRRPRDVHETGDLPADLALQRAATRDRPIGPRHARKVRRYRLDAGLGQSPLCRFGPIEGNAEKGAAGTALLAGAHRRRVQLMLGHE
jgi:hypothetical protein